MGSSTSELRPCGGGATATGELEGRRDGGVAGGGGVASIELGLGEAVEDKRREDEEGRTTHSVWREENETDK
jgi:hypothetical protein